MSNLPENPKFWVPNIQFPQIDWESIHKAKREQEVVDHGYAHIMYDRLMTQIKQFEETLKPDEEIGAYLSSFGAQILIKIDSVGYHNPYLIIFYGTNLEAGQQVQLVQHTSQLSVLFTAMKVKEDREPKRIGFHVKQDEDKQNG